MAVAVTLLILGSIAAFVISSVAVSIAELRRTFRSQ